ncbi:hypothetical protein BsWGS_02841 [Bradybaena similaris]
MGISIFVPAFWAFVICFLDTAGASVCPERCFCFRSNVRCMFLNLENIPNVPDDTTVLDLRFNKIKTIPRGSFPHLPHLHTLFLNNNELHELEEGSFDGLPQLRYLYLYKNKIQKIHPNAFRSIPHLEQLFLHSNELSKFPEHIFDSNSNLNRLRLDSNSLVCDCDMMWLADMLKEKSTHTQAAVICKYPSKFQGRSLMSIAKEDFHCEKPKITMQPKDVDVSFGNTVYFTCRAEGDPNPEIMWFHNDNMINTNIENRFNILDDGTLKIDSAQDSDKGVYECMARNAAGMAKTSKVELRYMGDQEIPKFMETPNDLTVIEGEDAELVCHVMGNPRPDITWTLNSDPITGNIRARKMDSGSLVITNIRVSDAGTYECSASNSVKTISSSARIKVLVRPVIISAPADVTVTRGTLVNFTCEARGDSQPVLTWTKDGELLRNNGRYEVLRNGQMLRIHNAAASDQGKFTCKAENAAGSTTASGTLRIVERSAPSFSESNDLISAAIGSDVTLHCRAEGRPDVLYDWMRDGRVLQNRNRISVQAGELRITNVQAHDIGRYDCVAENILGKATKSIFLQVQGATSVGRIGDQFVSNAIPQATHQVNSAVNTTLSQLFNRNREHTVQDLLAAFRYPTPEALDLARAEEIFEQTLEIIHRHVSEGHSYNLTGFEASYQELVSPSHIHMIANMSGCLRRTHAADCSDICFHRRYRTMDGTCNNLQNPTWGAANTAFNRLLPAIYENGFNAPVGWNRHRLYKGTHLPSARLVSSLVISTEHITSDETFTHMLMQWGQFIDHDMDLSPQAISFARFNDGRRCNETCESTNPCFPIAVPTSDPRIRNHQCLGFTRSSATCNTDSTSLFFNTVSPRQQLNSLTSYIDASNVYGSTDRMANIVRDLASNRGLLREGPSTATVRRLLPFDEDTLERPDCQIEPSKRHIPCFIAGDVRVNEQLALIAMHTLWMRQHNHMAVGLNRINPHWDGNKVYHEARKIMGALFQHITFKHWLPKVLGPKGMAMIGPYEGYKPDVNPSIVNEFAVAAMRFGHTLIQPIIFRLNETFHEIPQGHLSLHQVFFAPHRIIEEGGLDPLIRGLFAKPAKKKMPGELLNSELTEKLFQLANAVGQDLASLNIQRGRDHGTQFYNDYREFCGLPRARTFDDLRSEIPHKETRDKLQALYSHPDNIDLFVGGVSEYVVEGAKVGPTFLCILSDQFKRLRDGDRFWYEREGVFTSEQLVTIQQTSIASAICESSDSITRVQKDVFLLAVDDDDYVPCNEIPKLDLNQWTDCCEDCRTRATLSAFAARFRSRRSADFSYPEDEPEFYNSSSSNTNTANSKEDKTNVKLEPVSITEDVAEMKPTTQESQETATCMKDDLEMMDSRIEGMEEALMEMTQLINRLKKKIRLMEKESTDRRKITPGHLHRIRGKRWKFE